MDKSGLAANVISLPKGGGALKSIGDSFAVDPHSGTGNLTVPIDLPPGRHGLQPEIALGYSTGQGNSPFGLGWSLGVPGICRDTSHGFPTYNDSRDRFVLSGAEQLVAVSNSSGATRYRPRTEGPFSRITHFDLPGNDYWEVRSRAGLTSHYGHPGLLGADPGTVRDPGDLEKVYAWNITHTQDPFGNRIEYRWERDEATADSPRRWDQLYLKSIRYVDHGPATDPKFLVNIDFVYESRPDPFSSYRSGFEVRTTRRCSKIEVRTLAETAHVVRAYHLIYADQVAGSELAANGCSLLHRIRVEGVDGARSERMPPVEFRYAGFSPSNRTFASLSGSLPERSLAHPDFELVDLRGGGLPDLVQLGELARYWTNHGDGSFEKPQDLGPLPGGLRLGDRGVQLADVDGDGHIDVLISTNDIHGHFPLTTSPDARHQFVTSSHSPPFSFDDPEVRMIDLDGDGVTDALRTGTNFELYFQDPHEGWARLETVTRGSFDDFPDVHFSDSRVKLADMTGDGLLDIVFVENGSLSYWPYLGGGRWGRRISMVGSPRFADQAAIAGIGFDPKRLLVGDLDGDGAADLAYVEHDRVTVWLNRCGNTWADPIVIHGIPPMADVDAVRLADMTGNGSDGILWTYDFHPFSDGNYKFLDLTGGVKPYLMTERTNHMGSTTTVDYVPSTKFRIDDDVDPATRWIGRLPFPVSVVAKVQVIDEISGSRLATEYRYHHGYWDGLEREFRGFGMVEQLDSEAFDVYQLGEQDGHVGMDQKHFSPPTLNRSWFHQGLVQNESGSWTEPDFSRDKWAGDEPMLDNSLRTELGEVLASAGSDRSSVERYAMRALRGSLLRTELFALDGSPSSGIPYTVTEAQFDVREVDPRASAEDDRWPIFLPFSIGSRSTQWERGTDPMTQVSFDGPPDAYGLPTSKLEIAVPRGRNPREADAAALEPYLSTYDIAGYARRDDDSAYIVDRSDRSTSWEVANDGTMSALELRELVFGGAATMRVLGHSLTYFDGEAFVGLPLGQIGSFGAAVRAETLAFTDEFLERLFDPGDPRSVGPRPPYLDSSGPAAWPVEYVEGFRAGLPELAGYMHRTDGQIPGSPGGYYIAGQRFRYDFQVTPSRGRGQAITAQDQFGAETSYTYDQYDFLPTQVLDPTGLTTTAEYDYRVLHVKTATDPNGNQTTWEFSPLGLVTAQFIRGPNGSGDTLNPNTRIEYDLMSFIERKEPVFARTIRRCHHDSDQVAPDRKDDTVESIEYSDGFGRTLQMRIQDESVAFGDEKLGGGVLSADQSVATSIPDVHVSQPGDRPNVLVSGWQVYDNKGRVVVQYEPFFSKGWAYRAEETDGLQATRTSFDPRGQTISTTYPNGSKSLQVAGVPGRLEDPMVFVPTPWEAYTYDQNDNAGRTHPGVGNPKHWNTPSSVTIDALGRAVEQVQRNGADPGTWVTTRFGYDIQGNQTQIIDALGRTAFTFDFDLAQRRWRVDSIDAGRKVCISDVRGNMVEARDAKGAISLYGYDISGRPVHVWARDTSTTPMTLRQQIGYGDGGRSDQPVAEREAAKACNLLGGVTRHHDEAGLTVVDRVDLKGNVVNKRRRVIADEVILAPLASAPANGWNVAPFQVDWQPGPNQSMEQRELELLGTQTYETSSEFDALGRMRFLRLPEDVEGRRREVHYEFGRGGSLQKLRLDDVAVVEEFAHNARGQRTLVAYGNSTMTRFAYDEQTSRLKRQRSERYLRDGPNFKPQGPALQDSHYEHDLAGNVLTITDRSPGSGSLNNPEAMNTPDPLLGQLLINGDALIRRFEYDSLNRLTSASGREHDLPSSTPPWHSAPRGSDLTRARPYTEQYRYDAAGNLLELAHNNSPGGFGRLFSIPSESNRMSELKSGQDVYPYTFDANGNVLTEATSRHFEWNHADELRRFRIQPNGAEPSVYAQYLYDATGERVTKLVRKQGGSYEVTHTMDGDFEHQRWVSPSGQSGNNHINISDGQHRIASVRLGPAHPEGSPVGFQYMLSDHVGSCTLVLDDSGAPMNREEFSPYGDTTFGSFARKRFRYTGRERDEESGLSYHSARYYSPGLARWMSCDPAGPVDGPNLYTYTRNNPVLYVDVSGKESAPQEDIVVDSDTSGTIAPLDDGDLQQVDNTMLYFDENVGWLEAKGDKWILSRKNNIIMEEAAPQEPPKKESWAERYRRGVIGGVLAIPKAVVNAGAQVVDMGSMGVSSIGKATGWYDVGYSCLSSTCTQYKAGVPQSELLKQASIVVPIGRTVKSALEGDPEAIGGLVGGAIVGGTLKTFKTGEAGFAGSMRKVAGYELTATAERVGSVYKMKIQDWRSGMELAIGENDIVTQKMTGQGLSTFSQALKAEAKAAGATTLEITGTMVENPLIQKLTPQQAAKFGYTLEHLPGGNIRLTTPVR